jgi:hypothetical protein
MLDNFTPPELAEGMISQKYAFTVTLRPPYRGTTRDMYHNTKDIVKVNLLKIAHQVTIVTELTQAGVPHYHGMITFSLEDQYNVTEEAGKAFKPCTAKFHSVFRKYKEIGRLDIRPVTDDKGWEEYLGKDLLLTQEMINAPPILWDDFMVFHTQKLVFETTKIKLFETELSDWRKLLDQPLSAKLRREIERSIIAPKRRRGKKQPTSVKGWA